MPQPCTVIIAAPDLLPKLAQRAADPDGEVLAFTDADALRALEVIMKRRPALVALERAFAGTPRGNALVNRIKADPALAHSEIRVVAHDSDLTRAGARRPPPSLLGDVAPVPPKPVLDQRGTRRAPRFRIGGAVEVIVDGNQAALVDLSLLGAQVVSASVLKPNQRVRMAITDELGTIRFNAAVAWASFEIPPRSGPRYRAGLEFIDASADALEGYCARHKL